MNDERHEEGWGASGTHEWIEPGCQGFFFLCEQCECRRMSNSVEWNTGTCISRILMRRIILKMRRDVFVPTKTTKCVIPSWYYNINAYIVFTFTYLRAEILESEPAKRFTVPPTSLHSTFILVVRMIHHSCDRERIMCYSSQNEQQ